VSVVGMALAAGVLAAGLRPYRTAVGEPQGGGRRAEGREGAAGARGS